MVVSSEGRLFVDEREDQRFQGQQRRCGKSASGKDHDFVFDESIYLNKLRQQLSSEERAETAVEDVAGHFSVWENTRRNLNS